MVKTLLIIVVYIVIAGILLMIHEIGRKNLERDAIKKIRRGKHITYDEADTLSAYYRHTLYFVYRSGTQFVVEIADLKTGDKTHKIFDFMDDAQDYIIDEVEQYIKNEILDKYEDL